MFKRLKRTVIFYTVLGVAGVAAYHILLDKQAREDIRALGSTVSESVSTVATLINGRIGTIMDEDVIQQNRQQVRDAWADLGY